MFKSDSDSKDKGSPKPIAHGDRMGYLRLRPWIFALIWVAILLLHAFCAFYFVSAGIIYERIPGSVSDLMMGSYNIGMAAKNYTVVSVVQFFFGALHCFMGLLMVVWTIHKRRWSFGPVHDKSEMFTLKSFSSIIRPKDTSELAHPKQTPKESRRWVRLLQSVVGRDGFFGVNSPYFDQIMAVREIIETSLQTQQAYTMSRSLARPWLNRFYVATLVVNCWSVPLISRMYEKQPMHRRLIVLILDTTLDLLSSIGVSALLMLSYYNDFDPSIWSFPFTFWMKDQQFVAAQTEFPIMLIMSWGDLVRQGVFCFGLLLCLEDVKDIMQVGASTPALPDAVAPTSADAIMPKTDGSPRRLLSSFRRVHSHVQKRLLKAVEVSFILLGIIVLALHLQADYIPDVTQCITQVRPWAEPSAACALVHVDCVRDGHDGASSVVEQQWKMLNPTYVRRTVVTHCPAFEMPQLHQTFSLTKAIKMYNTTIAKWTSDAALTGSANPNVVLAYFFRVNVTGGELPQGLVAADFPPLLMDILFSTSNLQSIPLEIASRWNTGAWFNCNNCQLTKFPEAFKNWQPNSVSLSENPFTDFPWEVFEMKGLVAMENNGNAVRSFVPDPYYESLIATSDLAFITCVGSNISFLPRWVDTFFARPRELWFLNPLDLSMSPLCDAIQELHAGTRQRFPEELTKGLRPDELSDYMYLTSQNISALDLLVTCSSTVTLAQGTQDDDEIVSLSRLQLRLVTAIGLTSAACFRPPLLLPFNFLSAFIPAVRVVNGWSHDQGHRATVYRGWCLSVALLVCVSPSQLLSRLICKYRRHHAIVDALPLEGDLRHEDPIAHHRDMSDIDLDRARAIGHHQEDRRLQAELEAKKEAEDTSEKAKEAKLSEDAAPEVNKKNANGQSKETANQRD
ncbi:hypothetical protein ATCC90586_009811 [Pythium insidiosum]|nr:hypothetical protein ATCC90586_009811 [Pythium insidiosum]